MLSMKKKYRIRKYIDYDFDLDAPIELYCIEQKFFGLIWFRIEQFEPITSAYRFTSIEQAEDVLRQYINYENNLHENGKVVKTLEL